MCGRLRHQRQRPLICAHLQRVLCPPYMLALRFFTGVNVKGFVFGVYKVGLVLRFPRLPSSWLVQFSQDYQHHTAARICFAITAEAVLLERPRRAIHPYFLRGHQTTACLMGRGPGSQGESPASATSWRSRGSTAASPQRWRVRAGRPSSARVKAWPRPPSASICTSSTTATSTARVTLAISTVHAACRAPGTVLRSWPKIKRDSTND